jgi:two-component system NtrC family sensor kinase
VDQVQDDVRWFELGTYVREVVDSLSAELRQRQIYVEVIGADRKLECTTRAGAIAQVITNLVMNASLHAYGDVGGGRVEIELGTAPDDAVSLIVRDFGKGIEVDARARIFEPFFTTRRGSGGTGLGLNIVYNLATRSLGGTIECRSTVGSGSEFELVFPATLPRTEADTDTAVAGE